MESIITYKVHSQHNYNESLGNFPQAFCVDVISVGMCVCAGICVSAGRPLRGRLLGGWGEVVIALETSGFYC